VWVGTDEKNMLNYGELNGTNVVQNKQNLINDMSLCSPSLAVWNNKLYIAYKSKKDNGVNVTRLIEKDGKVQREGSTVLDKYTSPLSISLAVWNNKLYIASKGDRALFYAELKSKSNGTLELEHQFELASETSNYAPSLVVCNNRLYIAWIGIKESNTLIYGVLDGKTKAVQEKQVLKGITSNMSPGCLAHNSSISLSWLNTAKQVSFLSSTCFLNGKPIGSLDPIAIQNPLPLGTDGKSIFTGQLQETLLVNQALIDADAEALYKNSKAQITRDFDAAVPVNHAFGAAVSRVPVLSQPNSYIVNYRDAEFLAWPYHVTLSKAMHLACCRLNTTAVRALSELLLQEGIDSLLSIYWCQLKLKKIMMNLKQ